LLLGSAGVPFVAAPHAFESSLGALDLQQLAVLAASLLALAAGFSIMRQPNLGRLGASLSILLTLGLLGPHLVSTPFVTLAVLVLVAGGLGRLWGIGVAFDAHLRLRPVHEGRAQGSGLAALAIWSAVALQGGPPSMAALLGVSYALAFAAVSALIWVVRERRHRTRHALTLCVAAGVAGAAAVVSWGDWWWTVSGLVMLAALSSAIVRRPRYASSERTSWWDPLLGHPERLFVGTFASLCATGTLALALPQSASSGFSIGFFDAAFTATSAVCVTGLVVLDTARDFSAFGQLVILTLIQVGGLGIMTFSTVTIWALGQRMSLRHESAVASLISTEHRGKLYGTARRILVLTFVAEVLGTALLLPAFLSHGDTWSVALWRSVFTAISAFCNAGFALQTDSLVPYQSSPLVLHTIGSLIMLGGLSPIAIFALPSLARRSTRPVSAHAKLSLVATGALLVTGFLYILAFEWNDSLSTLSVLDRLHNAWFQSVTLRTAGFNSIDFAEVRPVTLSLMMLWMFIGGNPGGTAGGVKTTTISVLVLSVIQVIRGRKSLDVFGKRIGERTRAKAAVVVTLASATGVLALVAILLTQSMPPGVALFEVVSALGTVGLSTGGTAHLDGIGKIVISLSMFVGRVGGLSLLMFLSSKKSLQAIARPEEELAVG
jgi:trk system potassium uptake protein